MIFRVDSIFWVSEDAVRVQGGYYEAGLSASGNTYRVLLEKGRWVVKDDKNELDILKLCKHSFFTSGNGVVWKDFCARIFFPC